MKLIFAQGNPGEQYAQTRHNVGFLALDFYASERSVEFQLKPKFYAELAEFSISGEKVLLAKPTTFYNETGKSARAIADFYKLNTSDILVIHDELALPFGTIRTREKGSDAGNNGIKSLNAHLGEAYGRMRIGTWNEVVAKTGSFDFVLSKFNKEESDALVTVIFPKTSELVDQFIEGNHTNTSHRL